MRDVSPPEGAHLVAATAVLSDGLVVGTLGPAQANYGRPGSQIPTDLTNNSSSNCLGPSLTAATLTSDRWCITPAPVERKSTSG